jgi:hypothetical protein
MPRRLALALLALVGASAAAQAASTITVGDHDLVEGATGQTVAIMVSGDDLIDTVSLYMTINGGVGPAPVVTAVDYVNAPGLIFQPTTNIGNVVFDDPYDLPGLEPATGTQVTNSGDKVLADGMLALVTFDTTDVAPGVYSWSLLAHEIYGNSDLGTDANEQPIVPVIVDGSLIVAVPEPSTLALAVIAAMGAGLAALGRRKRRV